MITPGDGSATDRVRRGVQGFTRDALELAELQVLLFAEDFRKAKTKIAIGLTLLSVAGVLSLAVITVVLLACGGGLADGLDWPAWAGQLLVSGIALVLLVVAALIGVRLLIKSGEPLSRSASEFQSNWTALKTAVTGPSSANAAMVDPQDDAYQRWQAEARFENRLEAGPREPE